MWCVRSYSRLREAVKMVTVYTHIPSIGQQMVLFTLQRMDHRAAEWQERETMLKQLQRIVAALSC